MMPHVPIWVVALVLAVAAPVLVRSVAALLERRAKERTLAALARARAAAAAPGVHAASEHEARP